MIWEDWEFWHKSSCNFLKDQIKGFIGMVEIGVLFGDLLTLERSTSRARIDERNVEKKKLAILLNPVS